jgi:hypothetical protein
LSEAVSLIRVVASWWWRATQWLLARPYLLRPDLLLLLAALAIAALAYTIAYEPVGLALIPIALAAVTTVAAAINAYRLLRAAPLPLLFLSRFAAPTTAAHEVAVNHQAALSDHLVEAKLDELYEIRNINAPMGSTNALALVKAPPGAAVVFGSLRATADAALFDGKLAVRWTTWPRYGEPLSPVFDSTASEPHPQPYEAPSIQKLRRDAEVPLRKLVSQTFDVEHAEAIASILLVNAASASVAHALDDMAHVDHALVSKARDLLTRADALGIDVPPAVEAQKKIIQANINLGEKTDARSIISLLESQPGAATGVAAYWEHLIFLNEVAPDDAGTAARQLRYAQQLVRLEPENAAYHFYLGLALADVGERRARVLEVLDHSAELGDPGVAYQALIAKALIEVNSGDVGSSVRTAASAVALFEGPRALGVLSYTHLKAGKLKDALRESRKALRLIARNDLRFDSDLYTFEGAASTWMQAYAATHELDASSISPTLYSLFIRLYRRGREGWAWPAWLAGRVMFQRNPQDLAIHFPLSEMAMRTGHHDFAAAVYMFHFQITHDVDSLALATANMALAGHYLAAAYHLDHLRAAIHYEVKAGEYFRPASTQPTEQERAHMVFMALVWDKRLRQTPRGRWLIDQVYRRIPSLRPAREQLDAWLDSADLPDSSDS